MNTKVNGVIIKKLVRNMDHRGSTVEMFRNDDAVPINLSMGYFSYTYPGVCRGPHVHKYQTDNFIFCSGSVLLKIWDEDGNEDEITFGILNPALVTIKPGVVHGYINIGKDGVYIMNFPDRLYKGEDKLMPVDEIRYEETLHERYRM